MNRFSQTARTTGTYMVLIAIALIMLIPLLWLTLTAFKPASESIFPQTENIVQFFLDLSPKQPTWDNFVRVLCNDQAPSWDSCMTALFAVDSPQPFGRYFLNSFWIATLTVTLNLLFCSLAAYPLARLDFAGKDWIFTAVVSTIMIPFQIVMIPLYVLTVKLGLSNTYLGVIFPTIASAFGIFLLRQAFQGVPKELEEAARIDGCTELGIWWHVMLPSVRPALVTLAIFVFIGSWSEFLWPLLILDEVSAYTLPLGVARLASLDSIDWRLTAAGSVISIAPILLFFLIMQRYIVPSEVGSGLKG
ncbi:MAG: carbohydrate ABC transporter permease [Thermosynechococcaceae cyanobacterium]